MELKSLSVPELQKMKSAIEKELDGRKKTQRNKALGEIKTIAAKYGLKLSDVVGGDSEKSVEKKPRVKKAGNKTAVKAEKKIVYRHPENPALTWSGGRGRRPDWVNEWQASGRSLDEAKVA
jgi:DNA-binding protein H-NS